MLGPELAAYHRKRARVEHSLALTTIDPAARCSHEALSKLHDKRAVEAERYADTMIESPPISDSPDDPQAHHAKSRG